MADLKSRQTNIHQDNLPASFFRRKAALPASVAARVHFVARIFAHIPMMLAWSTGSSRQHQRQGHHCKQNSLFHQRS
jgi:hypothetical protein